MGSLSRSIRLERVRISLYNGSNIVESGLLSEYAGDSEHGYYLDFTDINNNSRVDSGDIFYIFHRGEVTLSWGIVLTYVPTENIICHSTLGGDPFLEPDDDNDTGPPALLFPFIGIIIANIVIIYVVNRI